MNDELSKEQLEASLELSPEELRFATLWLKRAESGLAAWQCVAQAYPGHDSKNPNSCNATAHRLINNNDRVRRFIHAMNTAALRSASYDTSKIIKMYQRQATPSAEKIDPYVEWRWHETDKGERVKVAWVPSVDTIPREFVEIIDAYIPMDDGYRVEYHEVCDEKTRSKAAEMIGKMAGDFVERVQHSGQVGSVTYNVESKDPKEASKEYTRALGIAPSK